MTKLKKYLPSPILLLIIFILLFISILFYYTGLKGLIILLVFISMLAAINFILAGLILLYYRYDDWLNKNK